MAKIFLDTNILVYGLDSTNLEKQNMARNLIKSLRSNNQGVLSTQVIQGFYVSGVKKMNIDPLKLKNIMRSLEHFEIITVDLEMIRDAVDCSILNQLSFWDALIIVSAEYGKCEQVWTEDLNHGQVIRGVKIINPFLQIL